MHPHPRHCTWPFLLRLGGKNLRLGCKHGVSLMTQKTSQKRVRKGKAGGIQWHVQNSNGAVLFAIQIQLTVCPEMHVELRCMNSHLLTPFGRAQVSPHEDESFIPFLNLDPQTFAAGDFFAGGLPATDICQNVMYVSQTVVEFGTGICLPSCGEAKCMFQKGYGHTARDT